MSITSDFSGALTAHGRFIPGPSNQANGATSYVVSRSVTTEVAGVVMVPKKEMHVTEDSVFAALPPGKRLAYLANHNKGDFIMSLLALFGGTYMLYASFQNLQPIFEKWFSFSAFAQAGGAGQGPFVSSRDSFDWYVGLLMGISLLCSWGITMFATKESKITYAKDTNRTIIGFVVGFLSGGRTH